MAAQMIHMVTAYKLMERLGINEGKEDFILGSVAPDSVYFSDEYIPRKIHSHLFEDCGPWGDTQDYEHWLVNIKAFWDKYVVNETDNSQKMFLMGIVVHCLTDYWNDLLIWRALQKKMIPPMTYESFREEYYPESFRIDRWLYQNAGESDEIMKLLHDSKERDFEDYLKAKEISQMKQHFVNEQYNLPDPIDVSDHKYYPKDMMFWFLDETTNRIVEQLNSYKS